MRKALLLAAALTIPAAGASAVIAGAPAWAAVKITCTGINGSLSGGTIQLTGCTGGNTGGSSQSITFATLAGGGTFTWTSLTTTTVGTPTVTSVGASKCPGYVKKGTNNPTADKVSGAVTGDSGNGLKVPGKESGEICIGPVSGGGTFSLLKPFMFS